MWMLTFLAACAGLAVCFKRELRWIYIMIRNLPRDIRITRRFVQVDRLSKKYAKEKNTFIGEFSSQVRFHPQKVAFYYEDQVLTFAQVEAFSNKISRYFISQGLKRGDTAALMLDNCPEYLIIFIGLARLGVVTALTNTNLVKDSLLHSVATIKPKAVIFGANYNQAIKEISGSVKGAKFYHFYERSNKDHDNSLTSINLTQELNQISDKAIEEHYVQAFSDDPIVYIYTSGTTGLPKASVVTNIRFLLMAKGITYLMGIREDDVVYSPLPMYHAGGCAAGAGQAMVAGRTVVLRKKFSASCYFKDCVKYKVTAAQYIGEMCRYILAAYSHREPEKHQVRLMFGNGLNALIWKKLVEKFNIKHIAELYGSTEGVSNLINIENKIGSVGYIPWFLANKVVMNLVKCDETGKPLRNSDGHCIKCEVNEPGVILGKIIEQHAAFRFKGYTDDKETQKKILCDVFIKGDRYFNSGDVLVYDEYGYYYFKDRTGDTFRWKSENVSTNEVESVISNLVKLNDVIVYGVEIPNTDGRVGMAAIVDPDRTINIKTLGNSLKSNLPSYSIPLFLRILNEAPLTGTFKLKKVDLRNEGYNIGIVKDSIYFFDMNRTYVPFNKQLYEDIINGKLRL